MEQVSTYTRPPTIEVWKEQPLSVYVNQVCIASGPAIIYREATHPPNFYFAPEEVDMNFLQRSAMNTQTYCEWKGFADYYDVLVPPDTDGGTGYVAANAAWTYRDPNPGFTSLTDCIAFYPNAVACLVGGEQVTSEANHFYGGWIWSGVRL